MNAETDLNDAYTLRQLDPADVRLFRSSDDDTRVRLTLGDERSWIKVTVARAFPFSHPESYVGLHDGDGKDIGIIVEPGELDEGSQAIVDYEIDRRYFTPTVSAVVKVSDTQGTVTWDVDTDRGVRHFVVRNIRDNAYALGPARIMLTDSEGNRYYFPDINTYGRKAYEVLAKLL